MSDETQKLVKIYDFSGGKWHTAAEKLPAGDDRPLAIITCIGDFGVGKSFLSNIFLNYLLLQVCTNLNKSCIALFMPSFHNKNDL